MGTNTPPLRLGGRRQSSGQVSVALSHRSHQSSASNGNSNNDADLAATVSLLAQIDSSILRANSDTQLRRHGSSSSMTGTPALPLPSAGRMLTHSESVDRRRPMPQLMRPPLEARVSVGSDGPATDIAALLQATVQPSRPVLPPGPPPDVPPLVPETSETSVASATCEPVEPPLLPPPAEPGAPRPAAPRGVQWELPPAGPAAADERRSEAAARRRTQTTPSDAGAHLSPPASVDVDLCAAVCKFPTVQSCGALCELATAAWLTCCARACSDSGAVHARRHRVRNQWHGGQHARAVPTSTEHGHQRGWRSQRCAPALSPARFFDNAATNWLKEARTVSLTDERHDVSKS